MGLGGKLKELGHTPILITASVQEEIEIENVFESGKNMIELKHTKIKNLGSIHLAIRVLVTIFKMRHEIDVLHLQQPYKLSAPSAILGRILGIPVVTTVHLRVPSSKNMFNRIIDSIVPRITFIHSDVVTFVSDDTKTSFGLRSGIVIKNRVDTNHFSKDIKKRKDTRQRLGLSDDFVFLFASRWASNKGIYELLQAFATLLTLADTTMKLALIGSGKGSGETDMILERINALGIRKSVLPLGVVDSIYEYYCMADVFVLPSYLEGLPMALLEAMSCGLVPIVSRVGGNRELINNGKNGFLVEPRNVDDLVQKMMWCISNKDKLEFFGAKAVETVKTQFSLEKVAEEYLEVYEKAIVPKESESSLEIIGGGLI